MGRRRKKYFQMKKYFLSYVRFTFRLLGQVFKKQTKLCAN
jgi:hypothetical protein